MIYGLSRKLVPLPNYENTKCNGAKYFIESWSTYFWLCFNIIATPVETFILLKYHSLYLHIKEQCATLHDTQVQVVTDCATVSATWNLWPARNAPHSGAKWFIASITWIECHQRWEIDAHCARHQADCSILR